MAHDIRVKGDDVLWWFFLLYLFQGWDQRVLGTGLSRFLMTIQIILGNGHKRQEKENQQSYLRFLSVQPDTPFSKPFSKHGYWWNGIKGSSTVLASVRCVTKLTEEDLP
jgi:hypothetical protein